MPIFSYETPCSSECDRIVRESLAPPTKCIPSQLVRENDQSQQLTLRRPRVLFVVTNNIAEPVSHHFVEFVRRIEVQCSICLTKPEIQNFSRTCLCRRRWFRHDRVFMHEKHFRYTQGRRSVEFGGSFNLVQPVRFTISNAVVPARSGG